MNDVQNEHLHKRISQLVLASSSPRRKELVALLDLSLPVSVFSVEVDERIDRAWQPAEAVELLSMAKAEATAKAIAEGRAPHDINPNSALILAADTVVVVDDQIVGKPASENEAFQMLKKLQGRSHYVYTGIMLLHSGCDKTGALQQVQIENEIMPAFVQETSESIAKPGNSAAAGESIARFNSRAAAKRIAFGAYGQYELVFQSDQLAAVVGHTYSQVTFRSMSDDEIYAYIKTGEPLDKAGSYGIQGIGSIFVEKIEGDFYSVMGLPLNLLYPTLLQFGISPFAT